MLKIQMDKVITLKVEPSNLLFLFIDFSLKERLENIETLPSLSIAIIRTMKGGKSYSHINASSVNPSCKEIKIHQVLALKIKARGLKLSFMVHLKLKKEHFKGNWQLTTIRIVMETAYICIFTAHNSVTQPFIESKFK